MSVSGRDADAGRIFISYRRQDAAYPAGWLFDRLADHFGPGQVFKDVDSIDLGDDFVDVIRAAVGRCDVLLAVIGDNWLTINDEHGRRRIDDPEDFVRLEIEAALDRAVRVIPVLVGTSPMPKAADLPPGLAALTRRQALEVSPSRFDADTRRLLRILDRTLTDLRADPAPSTESVPADPVAEIHPDAAKPQAGAPAHSPPADRPPSTSAAAQAPDDGPPALTEGQRGRFTRTRVLVGAAIVAGAAIITTLATVLLAHSNGGGTRSSPGHGSYRATASWRLRIDGTLYGQGCTVTLTNTDTDSRIPIPGNLYEIASYQITQVGSFRWQSNDARCLVTPLAGTGRAVLPFTEEKYGDTSAFTAPAHGIAVQVVDPRGSVRCILRLFDSTNGQELDVAPWSPGNSSATLNPHGRSAVYIDDDNCVISVSA